MAERSAYIRVVPGSSPGGWTMIKVEIEETWKKELIEFFESDLFENIASKVKGEYKTKTIYPNPKNIFRAFNLTPFDKVKVVILGQDPYHGMGQANGLCFSVPKGITPPPSLKNIYKEIKSDIGKVASEDGDLTHWSEQGVFLLNSILTVVKNSPASHHNIGWEAFTDNVIKTLSDKRENLVFILWGAYAQKKEDLIDSKKHLILKSPHPSPFSADRGFFGNKHFSKTNEYLEENGVGGINW